MIFPLLYTSFKNRMYNGMSSFLRKYCFIQAYRGRLNQSHQRRKVKGTARFSFHIWGYIREIISHDSLLFLKKLFKVGISPYQKTFLFASMIALQKWWKMFFISSWKLFSFSRYLNFCLDFFGMQKKRLD